jgi:hypothetical protein
LSPQRPELFANETLYQLSYTPNLFDFSELHGNLRKRERCLSIPAQADEGKRHRQRHQAEQQQPTSRSIPNVPCLKRHEINGNYYAVKKILGKIKRHSPRPGIRPDNRPAHLPQIRLPVLPVPNRACPLILI